MSRPVSRRKVLRNIVCAGTGALLGIRLAPTQALQKEAILIAGRRIEITAAPVSAHTVRISLVPIENTQPESIPYGGSLVQQIWAPPRARFRTVAQQESVRLDNLMVRLAP